jgi:hypothetical protein
VQLLAVDSGAKKTFQRRLEPGSCYEPGRGIALHEIRIPEMLKRDCQ